jgi:hypothetical protein
MASFVNFNLETNIKPQLHSDDDFSVAQCTPRTVYCPNGYKASRCNMKDVFCRKQSEEEIKRYGLDLGGSRRKSKRVKTAKRKTTKRKNKIRKSRRYL